MIAFSKVDSGHSTDAQGGLHPSSAACNTIVKLCVNVMVQCLNGHSITHSSTTLEDLASKDIPQELVKSIDFECVLCTG